MYFTDRGIEELAERRGEEQVSLTWLADRLRDFVDANPDFEIPGERFARADDDRDDAAPDELSPGVSAATDVD